jgi:hypothetical protein
MEIIMAQIGSFTRGENGIYTGEIRTLTLKVKATIRPVEREHDKSPDYRVSAGAVEFGAGPDGGARRRGLLPAHRRRRGSHDCDPNPGGTDSDGH